MLHSLIWLQSVLGIIINNYYVATFVSKERSLKNGTDPVPEVWCVNLTFT